MGYIKTTYECEFRFYKDSDQTTPVVWYFVDEDRSHFPEYHRFHTGNYVDSRIEEWTGPGEVKGTKKFKKVKDIWKYKGDDDCRKGTLQQFAEGMSINDPPPPAPACCQRQLGMGGVAFGGEAEQGGIPISCPLELTFTFEDVDLIDPEFSDLLGDQHTTITGGPGSSAYEWFDRVVLPSSPFSEFDLQFIIDCNAVLHFWDVSGYFQWVQGGQNMGQPFTPLSVDGPQPARRYRFSGSLGSAILSVYAGPWRPTQGGRGGVAYGGEGEQGPGAGDMGSGGVAYGGEANQFTSLILGSGGVAYGGEADQIAPFTAGEGGVAFGGEADQIAPFTAGEGGVAFGGDADEGGGEGMMGSGGIAWGGEALIVAPFMEGEGGIGWGGEALIVAPFMEGSGGIAWGGEASQPPPFMDGEGGIAWGGEA